VPGWGQILERAETPPADIEPGLMGTTLEKAGVRVTADSLLGSPALIAVDRYGHVDRTRPFACLDRRCPGVTVVPATTAELPAMVERLRGDDLLIAFERPPPPEKHSLAIGVAGEGFGDGNLTSDTTRTDGFVLGTDIAPTILDRYGIERPDPMSGRPLRSEGDRDAAGIAKREKRMTVVAGRRPSVVLRNLEIWLLLAVAVALVSRGRLAPHAFSMFGLAAVYLPAMLLVGAAIRPEGVMEERLIVGLGAPLLAALTLWLARGWLGLAVACAATVGAYGLDMILGSPLTAQSLLGPNPGLGVRFFGIGNELEATLAVMIPVGVGAALAAAAERLGRQPERRTAIVAFLVAGGVTAALFAAGRFGADVGAAIVFPAGAAMAALAVPGALRRPRLVLAVVGAPVLALIALAAVDLVTGGNSHLSRSVLEAGGRDELAQVFERRLRLSASSFGRATGQPLFWISLAVIAVAVWQRHRILAWLESAPLERAGLAGASGAVVLGVVANDSGATFLVIGTIALVACVAYAYGQFAWTQRKSTPAHEGSVGTLS
jgi:hypothetical protein